MFSDPEYNPEADPERRDHAVLLRDDARELVLLGMEDLRRDHGSDDDFNDAVFYVTVTPYYAVIREDMKEVKEPIDTDGDSVEDYYDDFPEDPDRAHSVAARLQDPDSQRAAGARCCRCSRSPALCCNRRPWDS